MIKEFIIDNHIIKYQITFKKNKNTYFYFKKEGYIQINASKNQTQKHIFNYIKDNSELFIKKFTKISNNNSDNTKYYLFGKEYQKVNDSSIKKISINELEKTVVVPLISIDKQNLQYKNFEKGILLNKLNELKERYLNNGFINIENITFKTRYMDTRFGSCNPNNETININLHLVRFSEIYLEYVFLHEITHLVHHNHSKEYYTLLSKLCRDYKRLKKELNNNFNDRW